MEQIKIIFENKLLLVIEKPAGIVIHPGAGEVGETISEWLVNKYPKIEKLSWPDPARPGIVHRLDKDTSGLLILAKDPTTLEILQKEFQNHKVTKKYQALVFGKLEKSEGEITSFIGRDPNAKRQQASRSIYFDFEPGKKREAKTFYKVIKEYNYGKNILSLIDVKIDTGRTHQIRVQFKSLGHPIIGDQIYNIKHSRNVSKELGLTRQFLHAYNIDFINPENNQLISLESNLPKDLKKIIKMME